MVGEFDAAGDVVSVETLVFERLDPALDDAVGVRGAVAGADVAQVRSGGEPAGDCDGLHGGAVVGDHHQRDDLAGVGGGAVGDEPVPQQRLGGLNGGLQRGDQVCGALSRGHRARQGCLGGVVHHRAQPPDALGGGLELGEVRLPDPVAAHRRLYEGLPAGCGERAALGLVSHRLQQAPAGHGPLDARRRPTS